MMQIITGNQHVITLFLGLHKKNLWIGDKKYFIILIYFVEMIIKEG